MGEVTLSRSKSQRVEARESFFPKANFEFTITGPELSCKFDSKRHVSDVIFVNVPAKSPSLCPTSNADCILIEEMNFFDQTVEEAEQIGLFQISFFGDPFLVFEKLHKDIFRAKKSVSG